MQISKLSSVIWAVAVCASLVSVRAQDNPAQAAARAALMEQMNAQDAALPAAPVVPTPPPVAAPTNQIAMPDAAPTVAMPETSATPAPSGDNAAQAAARAALFEAMQIPNPTPAAPAPVAQMPAPVPVPAVVPAPVVPAMMPATNVVAAQPPMEKVQPKPAPPAVAKQPGNGSGFAPMVPPPLPISMTKEQQLQALNAKYIANQISPEEYFKQREAIVSGP